MKRSVKRGLWAAGVILLLLLAIPAGIIGSAFIGMRTLEPRTFGTDSVLKDGFVAIGVIDEGGGKVALIDAGNDPAGKLLLAELSRRGLGPEAVSEIFLTHGHPDHTAAAKLFPAARIYIGAGDLLLAQGKEGSHGPITKFMPPRDSGLRQLTPIAVDSSIPAGAKWVRAFLIPGHTAGSTAYLVDGLLFLGDSAGATSAGQLIGAPWAMSDGQLQNRQSLKRLAGEIARDRLEVKQLVFAHSASLDGPGPLLEFAAHVP